MGCSIKTESDDMPDFDGHDDGHDDELSEVPVTRLSGDAPQNSREAAIQDAVKYYSPSPDDSRSHEERREQAIGSVLAQFAQAGATMQQSVMRSLMVQSLLDQGLIERLPPPAPSTQAQEEAVQDVYVQAVCGDARLAMRLMNKMVGLHPAQAGESVGAHAERLARIDFEKGFAECEYPTLHESAAQSAQAQMQLGSGSVDTDGVVDEERIECENLHLIAQALRIRLAGEERAIGVTQNGAGLPVDLDAVDLSVLDLSPFMLNRRQDGGDGGGNEAPSEYPRER